MAVFISYSSQDRPSLDALQAALRRAQQKVWFDQELGGGDAWWNKILEQIRDCDVFIVALSNNWLQSKPSQAELRYAQALQRPILPIRVGPVDSVRVNPVASLQIIDYQEPTVDAGIQLVTAIHALQANPQPLPTPLPEEPPVPFGYLMRLGDTLAEKEISPQQQIQMLVELKSGLDEDGDDPSARSDIAQLLRMLRLRHDVTYRTRSEIDNVLASIDPASTPDTPAAPATPATTSAEAATSAAPPATGPQPLAKAAPSTVATGTGTSDGAGSNKRMLIIGGVALVVIVAIAVVVMLVTQGGKSKPAAKPATPSTHSANLESYLLGPNDVAAIVGDESMETGDKASQLRTLKGTLSSAECTGVYEPIEEAAYLGASGFIAAHGQAVHTPGQDPAHRVFESVVAFSSAEKARAFVEASVPKWKACATKTVTNTVNGNKTDWTFGDVAGAPPKIEQARTEPSGRTCHHVLHAVSDVVIDVLVCGPGTESGQAGRIAEQISAKVG